MFNPGDKVICIKRPEDDKSIITMPMLRLKAHSVYTVTDINPSGLISTEEGGWGDKSRFLKMPLTPLEYVIYGVPDDVQ